MMVRHAPGHRRSDHELDYACRGAITELRRADDVHFQGEVRTVLLVRAYRDQDGFYLVADLVDFGPRGLRG
ncbi:MAG: hypothetical protein R2849_02140 [Thermomicrobiales bacterium]